MNRYRRRRGLLPPVVKWLLIANGAIFAAEYLNALIFQYYRVQPLTAIFAEMPLQSDIREMRPWQFITYQFMHADVMHIGMNMFILWMLGTEVEERWGAKRFLTYYLICGIGGAALHLGATYALGWERVSLVGASAAVSGALLAFGLMFPNRLILFIFIPLPAKLMVLIYAAVETARGLAMARGLGMMNVAHFAHLGGILVGFIYLKWIKPDKPNRTTIHRF